MSATETGCALPSAAHAYYPLPSPSVLYYPLRGNVNSALTFWGQFE
jgi:hypothetical protein